MKIPEMPIIAFTGIFHRCLVYYKNITCG